MWGKIIGLIIVSFLLGFTTQMLVEEVSSLPVAVAPQEPVSIPSTDEVASPADWILEEQIHVSTEGVVIDIEDPEWAKFTDTNSMDPVIDEGSHAIQIKPTSIDQIHIGDIISYKSERSEHLIIHRVVELGNDGEWYAVTKGDNNAYNDPQRVRFEQIERVLVAIIY